MNILVANNHLDTFGGTEKFTYALIEELSVRERLHVEYFTLRKGEVSDKIENVLSVKFMSMDKYDLILANHNSTVERIWNRGGLVIQTIHGLFNFIEKPSVFADRFVSISEEISVELSKRDIPSIVINNGINFSNIKRSPLNNQVKKLVSLSQSNIANNKIAIACKNLNIEFIRLDKFKDKVWNVYEVIKSADIAVGLGRSAYDAMACGRPVIVYDEREYNGSKADGYLPDNLFGSIKNNCSGRYYNKKFEVEDIENEILKYKITDGDILYNFSREHLNIEISVDRYLDYYKTMQKTLSSVKKYNIVRAIKKIRVLHPFLNFYSESQRSKVI